MGQIIKPGDQAVVLGSICPRSMLDAVFHPQPHEYPFKGCFCFEKGGTPSLNLATNGRMGVLRRQWGVERW